MTTQKAFKSRVRARMAKTGERYGAARRALLSTDDASSAPGSTTAVGPAAWVEQPETSAEAVAAATGLDWNEWCAIIDTWPERDQGHTAMTKRLSTELDDGWWVQAVVVGYERIRGLRPKYGRADGTFQVGVSRTIRADRDSLRRWLLDPATAQALLPGRHVELRSRATAKALRFAVGDDDGGVIVVTIDARDDDRVRLTVTHQKLLTAEAVEQWRAHWRHWLEQLDQDGSPRP